MKVTQLADPEEWESAEHQAREFRDWASGDGHGVLVDMLIDERIDAHDIRHHLRDVVIALDYVQDTGAANARMDDEFTKLHRHTVSLAQWYDRYAEALSDEVDDVRSERTSE